METMNDYYEMENGVKIPCIGFGTYQIESGDTAATAVEEAIEAGYRHIDCAAAYKNEASVGLGISNGLKSVHLTREEIFVTSKLWNSEQGYDSTLKAFEKTLKDLNLDYLDLYLIHWPMTKMNAKNWEEVNIQTWKAFERLYEEKLVRAIGVSNFMKNHLQNLFDNGNLSPMVNQIEIHPGFEQKEITQFSKEKGMVVEAWSPLGSGSLFQSKQVGKLAEKYHKSIAQLGIRWNLQKGNLPIPKSIKSKRIAENAEVFDFAIEESDMSILDSLQGCGRSGPDPVTFRK